MKILQTGWSRLTLVISISLPLYLILTIPEGEMEGKYLQVLGGLIFIFLLVWIIYFVTLWVIDGFKKNKD